MKLFIDTSAKSIDQAIADMQCVILFAMQSSLVLQAIFMGLYTVMQATYSMAKT